MMLNTDRETSERMQERGKKKRPLEDNAVAVWINIRFPIYCNIKWNRMIKKSLKFVGVIKHTVGKTSRLHVQRSLGIKFHKFEDLPLHRVSCRECNGQPVDFLQSNNVNKSDSQTPSQSLEF